MFKIIWTLFVLSLAWVYGAFLLREYANFSCKRRIAAVFLISALVGTLAVPFAGSIIVEKHMAFAISGALIIGNLLNR